MYIHTHTHTHTHTHARAHTHTHTHTHTQLLEAYRNLQKEHTSLKTSSTEAEKKAHRKIEELKEVQQLDQQAKVHMEEAFRLSLEEKEEKITVMQTQVRGRGHRPTLVECCVVYTLRLVCTFVEVT